MICYNTNQSALIHLMLHYSKTSILYFSGQREICCLSVQLSVSVCYWQTSEMSLIQPSCSTMTMWDMCRSTIFGCNRVCGRAFHLYALRKYCVIPRPTPSRLRNITSRKRALVGVLLLTRMTAIQQWLCFSTFQQGNHILCILIRDHIETTSLVYCHCSAMINVRVL